MECNLSRIPGPITLPRAELEYLHHIVWLAWVETSLTLDIPRHSSSLRQLAVEADWVTETGAENVDHYPEASAAHGLIGYFKPAFMFR